MSEMSASIPFLAKPPALNGELPGDVGFDPTEADATRVSYEGGSHRCTPASARVAMTSDGSAIPLFPVDKYGAHRGQIPCH